jgi:hypothetical protein
MAAIANLLAVALFPRGFASEARSVQVGDGYFASSVIDAICSLRALSKIPFTECHELKPTGCLVEILWIVMTKKTCVGRGQSGLLGFGGGYDIVFNN